MALFTDAAVLTLEDLVPFEASLGQVASSHGINVDNKISLALSAIGDKLLLWLLNSGASDPQWVSRRVLGLSTVVMTSALQRWAIFESLARVFAEAYNVQLNTRYQGKLTEYQGEAKRAAELFFLAGVALVHNPLPRPAMPLVALQSGIIPPQAMFIQTSWVDANGDESALSIDAEAVLPDYSSIAVAMAEGALGAPAAAVGWNLYAGAELGSVAKQNLLPLAIGSTWAIPASGLVAGPSPAGGQAPAFYVTLSRQIRRG